MILVFRHSKCLLRLIIGFMLHTNGTLFFNMLTDLLHWVETQARRRNEGTKVMDGGQELLLGIENPSRESVDTSLEVQTGNSVEVLSDGEGSVAAHARMQHKARAQATKFKVKHETKFSATLVLRN